MRRSPLCPDVSKRAPRAQKMKRREQQLGRRYMYKTRVGRLGSALLQAVTLTARVGGW